MLGEHFKNPVLASSCFEFLPGHHIDIQIHVVALEAYTLAHGGRVVCSRVLRKTSQTPAVRLLVLKPVWHPGFLSSCCAPRELALASLHVFGIAQRNIARTDFGGETFERVRLDVAGVWLCYNMSEAT